MPSVSSVRVVDVSCFVHTMHTRFPFRYGIASMTGLPHLFMRASLEIDGRPATGISAEHLPPKWFTKDPDTTFEEDLPALFAVVGHAASVAEALPEAAGFFDFWQVLYRSQDHWAAAEHVPPLLAHLGTSLVERAVLDGLCRGLDRTLVEAVHHDLLGLDLGAIHPELAGVRPADVLPASPATALLARHTVGLSDPLTEADVPADERINDGLPHTLVECIRTYGHTHYKIKVCGDLSVDLKRLNRIAAILSAEAPGAVRFTLDGNEQFKSMEAFRQHWNALTEDATVRDLIEQSLLFVEQPLHRSRALGAEVGEALAAWDGHPPLIIDESDATLHSARQALDLGYAGTSHKNCKGIVKGLANAVLIETRRRNRPDQPLVLSGEDLTNVGPVALLQDLTVMSLLGIDHVERNGHHYFKGLSMFPPSVQQAMLDYHGDLYRQHEQGFPTVAIESGRMQIESLLHAPFGVLPLVDLSRFTPALAWTADSL